MSLDPKERPDWAAAGWDWTGADDQRHARPPVNPQFQELLGAMGLEMTYKLVLKKDLETIQSTLELAKAALHEVPEFKPPDPAAVEMLLEKLSELSAESFVMHEKLARLRRDYWHNIVRAFAAGAIMAWVLWNLLSK